MQARAPHLPRCGLLPVVQRPSCVRACGRMRIRHPPPRARARCTACVEMGGQWRAEDLRTRTARRTLTACLLELFVALVALQAIRHPAVDSRTVNWQPAGRRSAAHSAIMGERIRRLKACVAMCGTVACTLAVVRGTHAAGDAATIDTCPTAKWKVGVRTLGGRVPHQRALPRTRQACAFTPRGGRSRVAQGMAWCGANRSVARPRTSPAPAHRRCRSCATPRRPRRSSASWTRSRPATWCLPSPRTCAQTWCPKSAQTCGAA